MNSRLLLAVLSVAALSSCSTAYKAQTPDDVYYSPPKTQPAQDDYVRVETEKERNTYQYNEDRYTSDDRYLRWKVRKPLTVVDFRRLLCLRFQRLPHLWVLWI